MHGKRIWSISEYSKCTNIYVLKHYIFLKHCSYCTYCYIHLYVLSKYVLVHAYLIKASFLFLWLEVGDEMRNITSCLMLLIMKTWTIILVLGTCHFDSYGSGSVVSFKMKHFLLSIAATRQIYTRGSLEDSLERGRPGQMPELNLPMVPLRGCWRTAAVRQLHSKLQRK